MLPLRCSGNPPPDSPVSAGSCSRTCDCAAEGFSSNLRPRIAGGARCGARREFIYLSVFGCRDLPAHLLQPARRVSLELKPSRRRARLRGPCVSWRIPRLSQTHRLREAPRCLLRCFGQRAGGLCKVTPLIPGLERVGLRRLPRRCAALTCRRDEDERGR